MSSSKNSTERGTPSIAPIVPTIAPTVTIPDGAPAGAYESPAPKKSLSISPVLAPSEKTPSMISPIVLAPNEVLLTPAQTPAMTPVMLNDVMVPEPVVKEEKQVQPLPDAQIENNGDSPNDDSRTFTHGTKVGITASVLLIVAILTCVVMRQRRSSRQEGQKKKKKKKRKKKQQQKAEKESMFTNLAPGGTMS